MVGGQETRAKPGGLEVEFDMIGSNDGNALVHYCRFAFRISR